MRAKRPGRNGSRASSAKRLREFRRSPTKTGQRCRGDIRLWPSPSIWARIDFDDLLGQPEDEPSRQRYTVGVLLRSPYLGEHHGLWLARGAPDSPRRHRRYLVGPYAKTLEGVRAERRGDCDIGRIAASSDEHAADARDVVSGVERVPRPTEVGFEPTREVHRTVGGRYTAVAEIACAIACRDIHTAAERDGQMCVIAADAFPFVEDLPRRLGRSRVSIIKGNMSMDEVADSLHAAPAGRSSGEQLPCRFRQEIGFTVSTSKQKHQGLFGQGLDCVLLGQGRDDVRRPGIVRQPMGRKAKATLWRQDAVAPVAEDVSIGGDGNRRTADHVVGSNDIGNPTIVNVQRKDDGSGLGKGIDQLVADANLHIDPRRTQTGERHRLVRWQMLSVWSR